MLWEEGVSVREEDGGEEVEAERERERKKRRREKTERNGKKIEFNSQICVPEPLRVHACTSAPMDRARIQDRKRNGHHEFRVAPPKKKRERNGNGIECRRKRQTHWS
jgi:hypothetical protein